MNTTATLGKIKTKKGKSSNLWQNFWTNEKAKSLTLKIGSVLLVLAILGGGSWKIAKSTDGKILPKVTVAGIKVGNYTPAEAKVLIQNYVDKLNDQGPEIVYSDQIIKPKLSEMGATFNVEKVVNVAYNYGREGTFANRVKENSKMLLKNYNVALSPEIDEPKLDGFLSQIAQVVEKAPVNASLSILDGVIQLSNEEKGRGLDKEKLKNDLNNLINTNKMQEKITLVTSDLEPQIYAEGTTDARVTAEKYMAASPITVTFEDQSYPISKAEIGSWITFSESGNKLTASLSNDKIGDFAGWVAEKVEIKKVDREVMEGTGEVLNEGTDGRGVDTGRLISEIREKVLAGVAGTSLAVGVFPIPKGEITKNPHAQPGRYEGRYIDINLSEQTLYAFEGTKLVNQFLISGGKTGPTPTGEFHVYSKSRSTLMDGPGYYLPNVEWVSWFSGDYSIHGTYWHNNFGHPMSHGCVNASNGDAEWLYNWDDIGTPVYIHY